MTVLELIQSTTTYFTKHGVENARLNCEHLVANALRCSRIDLYMQFDRPLDEGEVRSLREQVRKRASGVPLQHLLGTVEFYGRTFMCDGRALVPRPETERLVELVLEQIRSRERAEPRLLDVGTGSGVIALTLAAELPHATVEAVDLSDDALSLARENAAKLGLEGRVLFRRANLLEGTEGIFDGIVANLPYIATDEVRLLAREVRHDPMIALDGGPDGMASIGPLLAQATAHLGGGIVALEVALGQAARVQEVCVNHNYKDITVATDYQGVERFVFAQHG